MAVSKYCDYCGGGVESFHEYGGNIQPFGSTEACDSCWEKLNSERESVEKKVEAYRQKLIDVLKRELQHD